MGQFWEETRCTHIQNVPGTSITVTNDAQLDAYIAQIEAGTTTVANCILDGNFREIAILGNTGSVPNVGFYFQPGATVTYNGSNPRAGGAIVRVGGVGISTSWRGAAAETVLEGGGLATYGIVIGEAYNGDPFAGQANGTLDYTFFDFVKVRNTLRQSVRCSEHDDRRLHGHPHHGRHLRSPISLHGRQQLHGHRHDHDRDRA